MNCVPESNTLNLSLPKRKGKKTQSILSVISSNDMIANRKCQFSSFLIVAIFVYHCVDYLPSFIKGESFAYVSQVNTFDFAQYQITVLIAI